MEYVVLDYICESWSVSCRIVPGQLIRGKLNEVQTRDMIKVASMRPQDRIRFIREQVKPLIRDSTSQAFGVHISSDMVQVRT